MIKLNIQQGKKSSDFKANLSMDRSDLIDLKDILQYAMEKANNDELDLGYKELISNFIESFQESNITHF